MAITPNTTFTAGDVLTADEMNRLPWGIVARSQRTSNQAGIGTTTTDLTDLSVTFTAISTRIYRTTIYAIVQQDTTGGLIFIRLADGSNTQKQQWMMNSSAWAYYTACLQLTETGLSGSTTRKARGDTQTSTFSIQAAAAYPAFIIVEDLGQA